MWANPQKTTLLFTEKILNGELDLLCGVFDRTWVAQQINE